MMLLIAGLDHPQCVKDPDPAPPGQRRPTQGLGGYGLPDTVTASCLIAPRT